LRRHPTGSTGRGSTQTALGEALGYEKTYICLLETGRRTLADVVARRRIAACLGIPAHVLGATDPADADFACMIAFAPPTLAARPPTLGESASRTP